MSGSESASQRSANAHKVARLVLWTVLLAIVVGGGGFFSYAAYRYNQERAYLRWTEDNLLTIHGLAKPGKKTLGREYVDRNGDLLADPPTDPAGWLDPETIVLAHYIDAEAETQAIDWEGLERRLEEATGKKIVAQEYRNSADDVEAVKAGKIQVVALHAADTPYLVNHAGFVPTAILGTETGVHGNHLVIAASPKSNIKQLTDVRGHSLTCTTPDSITGYRAAIAILANEAGLRPDVDYSVTWSHGQKKSILGLAAGQHEVAALSDDKLQSLLKKGTVEPAQYRVIYESQVVPRLTIGHVYNLRPGLARLVAATVVEFANEMGSTDDSDGLPMRFYPSDYKQDFRFVRDIDDSFDPRFGKQQRAKPALADLGGSLTEEPAQEKK